MAPQPYAKIHHYRVLDANADADPQDELYPVMRRIEAVLKKKKYDFVSLSVGPVIPVSDTEVHLWTAKLDELFCDGQTLAAIAAGNTGESDAVLRYNRIQPPADCVNALAVGACDSEGDQWKRASYSSVGFGRSPGFVKPDGVAFGGTEEDPFWVLHHEDQTATWAERGTSFSAPYVLRAAIGVRAQLGNEFSLLAIKALLIHNCERNRKNKSHGMKEVGWGRICTDVDDLITCAASTANIVYQGAINPKKVLLANVPMPRKRIRGPLKISATICFATDVDPQDPVSYTRSGLVVTFRPDKNLIPPAQKVAESESFFGSVKGMSEARLRRDAYKWEPTLHAEKTFKSAVDMTAPVLELHYTPRERGRESAHPRPIPYAMIISVCAPGVTDMYDQVYDRYRHELQQLRPRYRLTPRV